MKELIEYIWAMPKADFAGWMVIVICGVLITKEGNDFKEAKKQVYFTKKFKDMG